MWMIQFIREVWHRLRAPNEGRVLAWPWAVLMVTTVSLFYGIIAALHAVLRWFWRRDIWQGCLKKFGGSADDFFYKRAAIVNPFASSPFRFAGGNGGAPSQTDQQAHDAWARQQALHGLPPNGDADAEAILRYFQEQNGGGRQGSSPFGGFPPGRDETRSHGSAPLGRDSLGAIRAHGSGFPGADTRPPGAFPGGQHHPGARPPGHFPSDRHDPRGYPPHHGRHDHGRHGRNRRRRRDGRPRMRIVEYD
jgi:hypothetical protein